MTDWLGFQGQAGTVPVPAAESLLLRAPGPDIRAVMPPAGEAPTEREMLLANMARVMFADLPVNTKLSLLLLTMAADQIDGPLVAGAHRARGRGEGADPRSKVGKALRGAERYLCPQIAKPGATPP